MGAGEPGVLAVAGSPPTWERSVMAAVLGAGSGTVASHATACHVWELTKRPRIIEVTVPRSGRPARAFLIHRSTDLHPADVTEVSGIPITTVARSLVDVGVPWGEGLAARALDEAVRRHITELQLVANVLHRVARRGRRGVG